MDLLSKLESIFGYHVHDPDVTKGCVTTKITGFSSSRRRQPPLIWNSGSGAYWEVCRQISCVRCCWQSDSPRILRSTASHKDSVAEDWQVTPSASCRADLIDRTHQSSIRPARITLRLRTTGSRRKRFFSSY